MSDDGNEIAINERTIGNQIPVLGVRGTLDWDTHQTVDSALSRHFNEGRYFVVIDLAETEYVTSAGFGSFIANISMARRNGGNIVFLAAPPQVKEVFSILGLTPFMTFAEDDAEALAAFDEPLPATPGANLADSSSTPPSGDFDGTSSSVDLPIPE